MSKLPLSISLALLICLLCATARANTRPEPMDAAAAAEMPGTGLDTGTVTDDPTIHTGHWSFDEKKFEQKLHEQEGVLAPDDPSFHSGYWSATGGKSSGTAEKLSGNDTVSKQTNSGQAGEPATPSSEGSGIDGGHSVIVTDVEKCYSQLDPVTAATIRDTYVKPYEECQRRLSEKTLQQKYPRPETPPEAETPRNYVRVQSSSLGGPAAP
jgi:hypothetical protein